MAVSGDVIAQDGGEAKPHPYLVALIRWCMSRVWTTATVILHRLLTAPLQPITASRSLKSRPAGKEHLDPEPRVECVVLHHPPVHTLDVIFVHGLYVPDISAQLHVPWSRVCLPSFLFVCYNFVQICVLLAPPARRTRRPVTMAHATVPKYRELNKPLHGSLGNTWRQGEWGSKYGPEKIHFKTSTSLPTPDTCHKCTDNLNHTKEILSYNENDFSDNDINKERNDFINIDDEFYEDIKRILPNDQVFITETFYNNTLLDQVEIVDNYEAQAKFVSDLFKSNCDSQNMNNDDQNSFNDSENRCNDSGNLFNDRKTVINDEEYVCKCHDTGKVEVEIKEIVCKCKANEAKDCEIGCGCICDECYSHCWPKDWIKVDYPNARVISINYTSDPYLWRPLWVKENKRLRLHERAEQMTQQLLDLHVGKRPVIWVGHSKGGLFVKQIYCEAYEAYLKTTTTEEQPKEQTEEQNMTEYRNDNEINNLMQHFNDYGVNTNKGSVVLRNGNNDGDCMEGYENPTELVVEGNVLNRRRMEDTLPSSNHEDKYDVVSRAGLWTNSAGFMFYSVPHRGSSLADIKTPLTARSIELLEITKDCSLLRSLQDRWLRAAAPAPPLVRSLVETRRTLMSVLWLRIVSSDSADPGIGGLCGVSVDHREICKPASRRCLLYTELAALIGAALNKCRCQV